MSIENTAATIMNVFRIRISEGRIQNILSQLSDSLGDKYSSPLQAIRDAQSRHIDSTPWRIDWDRYNLRTFLTKTEAKFIVRKRNGHEVLMERFAEHKGTDIHDRHSAFETMASKTNNDQQYCWSHIICNAKELEDFCGFEGAGIKRPLQAVFSEAKTFKCHSTMQDVETL